MKYLMFGILIIAITATSCKKSEPTVRPSGYLKSIDAGFDQAAVGMVKLDDHSVIVASRSFTDTAPGYLYNFSPDGEINWKRKLSKLNTGLWQICDIPGNGFLTLGYENQNDKHFNVCKYDDNGNLVSSNEIATNYIYSWYSVQYFSNFQVKPLANGNYVFAASNTTGQLNMIYTNSNYDTLHVKQFYKGDGLYITGICENSDSTIMISTTRANGHPSYVDYYWTNTFVTTDFNGNILNSFDIGDTSHSETPGVLLKLGSDMLAVTGRMGEMFDGSGAMIGYFNNGGNMLCSGEINLLKFGNKGNIISRYAIRNYPENGLVVKANPTNDGGYILCGIVDQADETSMVSNTKIYLMKINSSGVYQWSRYFKSVYPSYGIDVVQTQDGGYIVSGYEKTFGNKHNLVILKTDEYGNL